MRELTTSEKNEMVIFDQRSNTEIELYYRSPTPREEALYQAKLVKKKGRKVVIDAYNTRLMFGLRIITGFREGDFGLDGQPVSTDPESGRYREDWKKFLEKGAPDIVTTLARVVFEGASPDSGIDIEDAEVLEDEVPLEKS